MAPERGSRLSLTWAHRAEQSIDAWERDHARGEVPSEWPYGFDALRDYADVHVLDLPDPGRIHRIAARLGVAPRPAEGLAIAWDENTAYRMQILHPRRRFASGVIWLTDLVDAGAAPARLIAMLRGAESVWVLSEAQIAPLRALLGAHGPRVFAVPFGIDAEFFPAAPYPERERIVSIGNDRDRDPTTLFAALGHVLAVRPDVEIVVQSRSDIEPPDGVRVIRQLSHAALRDLYATASVVVTATRPNLHVSGMTVTLEALATGRPVVNTDTPGMVQYVHEGTTGLLVPPGDPEALAHSLLDMLRDPARAAEMGRNGRDDVERHFTTRTMVTHLMDGLLPAA